MLTTTPRVSVGQIFGRWTVLAFSHKERRSGRFWQCRCNCGVARAVSEGNLLRGLSTSCGCYKREGTRERFIQMNARRAEKPMEIRLRLFAGQRFTRWTVLEFSGKANDGTQLWKCRCECGTIKIVRETDLVSEHTRSCGCYRLDYLREQKTTHGMSQNREYRIWSGMKTRCLNPRSKGYSYYGGRGITVCARWRDSFEAFYQDLGPRPSPQHSLERVDNDGNYEPGNVRWAQLSEQATNKRRTPLGYQGQTKNAAEWAREKGLSPELLWWRLKQGWTIERALTTPARKLTANLHPTV
jgi:hypothetical protein